MKVKQNVVIIRAGLVLLDVTLLMHFKKFF